MGYRIRFDTLDEYVAALEKLGHPIPEWAKRTPQPAPAEADDGEEE